MAVAHCCWEEMGELGWWDLDRETHFQRHRRGGETCCLEDCAVCATNLTRGECLGSVTLPMRFSPSYEPYLPFFLLILERRLYSVYVHPFQVLQLRTIWFFCPSCLPPSTGDSARKKEAVRSKQQSLRLRTCLDLTYSREGSSPIFPCVSRLIFMWKCLWTFVRASRLSFNFFFLI